MVKRQIIELTARKKFDCLGEKCPQDCCHGWDNIQLDDATVAKWSSWEDEAQQKYLSSFITTLDGGEKILAMTEAGKCRALDKEGLCEIQSAFGHETLSRVCREFPRLSYGNNLRKYQTASFSCPPILEKVLFSDEQLLTSTEEGESVSGSDQDLFYYYLDEIVQKALSSESHTIGTILFFVSDILMKIVQLANNGELNENTLQELSEGVDEFLDDISKAVKLGKLKVNPVTAGSIWKSIYNLCLTRGINPDYLDDNSGSLKRSIDDCDDSFSSYSKIYANIKSYKKSGNKILKQKYNKLLRRYVRVLFLNKGIAIEPRHSINIILADTMACLLVMQLLLWVEIQKSGELSSEFLKRCILEVDRKVAHADVVIKTLKKDPHMTQVDKYCHSFLDLF